MADLTPELLAQLESEATSRVTVWAAGQPLDVCASATHDVVLALVAAAKERDQLRRQIDRIRGHFGECMLMDEREFEKIVKGEAP